MKNSIQLLHRSLPLLLAAVLFAAAFTIGGCSGEAKTAPVVSPESAEAPELPPATTMSPALDQFPGIAEYQTGGDLVSATGELPGENWTNAVVRASLLSGLSGAVLSPPAAALALALSTEAERQGLTTWVWTYTGTFQDQAWDLELTVRGTAVGYEYELLVNSDVSELPLEDALWFDGEAALDLSEGVWRVYDPLDGSQRQTHEVDWTSSDATVVLAMTLVDPEAAYQGTELTWSAAESACLMTYDLIEQDVPAAEGVIEWTPDTGAGSIQATDYKDNVPSCWDENRQDVVCDGIVP